MRLPILLAGILVLAVGAFGHPAAAGSAPAPALRPAVHAKDVPADKRANVESTPELIAVASAGNDNDDEDDDEPKRLVVYFNFEKVNHKKPNLINDKSGYENSGIMAIGGEILKYGDSDFTCNQASRLWDSDISLKGDTFQAKPRRAITIAAWVKLEEKQGQHSIFDTIGTSHTQGQFHFEVNDGVVRWFHRDQKQKVVFETMAHSVPKSKWTHLAGEYNSKTCQAKVYINGEIRNMSIGEGELSRDWGVRAGIGNHDKNRPLRGAIDEFRIYNYALKSDEIKALVSACKPNGAEPPKPDQPAAEGGSLEAPKEGEAAPAAARSETAGDGTGGGEQKKPVSSDD